MSTLTIESNRITKSELDMMAALVLRHWDELGHELQSGFRDKFSFDNGIEWKTLIDVTQEDVIKTTPTLDDGDQTGVLNLDFNYEESEGILIARHYCRDGEGYLANFFMIKKEAFIDLYVENDAMLKAMEIVRTAFDEFKALPEPKSETETEKAES